MQALCIGLLVAAYVPPTAIRVAQSTAAAPAAIPLRTAPPNLVLAPEKSTLDSATGATSSSSAFSTVERALEALTGDPQLLLEAVVGLPGGVATYDRDAIVDYFKARPQKMVRRALDFLMAFRRIRAAWDDPSEGVDRGSLLRAELSALGPVAVKVGQTLSQRPDILPEDVCEALKGLQTSNEPFPNEEAYEVIAEDFGATGPIAPGIPATPGCDPDGPTLFKALSKDCIASASLGQVYRGTTHDGQEVAVKVQRPSALRQCLLDGSVIIVALKTIEGRYWNGDLLAIFDLVAGGIVQELDFRNEAKNGAAFRDSLQFLGYVDVPRTLPHLTTRRAMAMEWVYGRHLSALEPEEAMRMTYMSCEAVTAGLVITGLVHADPHEGNIMLADDGRLIFLDFGLMSRVEENIMEAFASGIQCVLSKDYVGLVKAFIDTGFVGTPIEWRAKEADPWQLTHPDGDTTTVMAKDLQDRMEACPGGGSRFGALSVVLGDMGFFWQMYTPPYVILLIRTFLTLEGIAGQVDPNFNIYEVALPWAIQRALSPSTESGAKTLRSSVLTADNTFEWERVDMIVEQQKAQEEEEMAKVKAEADKAARAAAGEEEADDKSLPEAASSRARLMAQEANKADLDPVLAAAGADAQAAQAATPLESLTTVLGSSNGATLRRIAHDLDSTELLLRLASPSARPARRMAVKQLATSLEQGVMTRVKGLVVPTAIGRAKGDAAASAPPTPVEWPSSAKAEALVKRKAERAKATSLLLLKTHAAKQIRAGWRGAGALASLVYVVMRVGFAALARATIRLGVSSLSSVLPKKLNVAASAWSAWVAAAFARELAAFSTSLSALAKELETRAAVVGVRREKGSDEEDGGAVAA